MVFRPGDHILELGCGTGEDAVWLGKRNINVTATDQSERMLEVTDRKVAGLNLNKRIQTVRIDLNQSYGWPETEYDGVLANFGVLNCVRDLSRLAENLSAALKPRSGVVFVFMNPCCLWEIVWFFGHGDLNKALRRLNRADKTALLTDSENIQVWYPSPAKAIKAFQPYFRLTRFSGLGFLLPPTYLQELFSENSKLLQRLDILDRRLSNIWPFSRLGDHYILEMEKCP
jgi:2-polyprenyl-3-methyl-5-hydroxy-6-metoxy-1,4-benzoquinol methylase